MKNTKYKAMLMPLVLSTLIPTFCIASISFAQIVTKNGSNVSEASSLEKTQQFALKKGLDIPVCKAYLKLLNETDFVRPPYCDRPESDDVPEFTKLNRINLSVDETLKLEPQINGFLMKKDIHLSEKVNVQRKQLGLSVESDAERRSYIESILNDNDPLHKQVRFDPPVDIDNDGIPDQVVLWRDTGVTCGAPSTVNDWPTRARTSAFILDAQDNVDPIRTQEVFGHPLGGYRWQSKDPKTGKILTEESDKFRPVGLFIGIFVFDGKTYFDTFYDSWGDLNNQRKKKPYMNDTLAVFKREHGKTEAVCEMLWKEPKQ
jgi:hypothetical protein